jgi:hypothetical protein
VAEVISQIAAASEQQDRGVVQVNTALEQMNAVTQQTAATSEESAAAAEELAAQAAASDGSGRPVLGEGEYRARRQYGRYAHRDGPVCAGLRTGGSRSRRPLTSTVTQHARQHGASAPRRTPRDRHATCAVIDRRPVRGPAEWRRVEHAAVTGPVTTRASSRCVVAASSPTRGRATESMFRASRWCGAVA